MRKLLESNGLMLLVYGSLLLGLASYFVIQENHLFHPELPLLFLIRFGVFWFVSLMIAVVLYLVHLSYFNFLKSPDKMLANRAGFFTFLLGVAGAILILAILYLYYKFPQYLNL